MRASARCQCGGQAWCGAILRGRTTLILYVLPFGPHRPPPTDSGTTWGPAPDQWDSVAAGRWGASI